MWTGPKKSSRAATPRSKPDTMTRSRSSWPNSMTLKRLIVWPHPSRKGTSEKGHPYQPDPIAPLEALPIAADPAVEAEGMNRFDTHAENPGEVKNPSEA